MEVVSQSEPFVASAPTVVKPEGARPYRRDIDGLRAIAVTSVVAYHAGLFPFTGGYVGVDIFFVISGYLIGAHVYRDVRRQRFSIAQFYQRRAKRILPALFGVLLFCYAVSLLLLDAGELRTLAGYITATVASASNILIWLKVDYFSPGANQNPLLMTWSLGVEEQFYLVFPVLMLLMGKLRRRSLFLATLAITLLSLALSILGLMKYRTATFYLLPTRAWELSVGILLAIYETDRRPQDLYKGGRYANWLGVLGLGLLLYAILAYNDNTLFPGLAAVVPVLGSALILTAPSGWVNKYLLSSKPFVFLGLVSYSWYLWHWPLLSFARIAADREVGTGVCCVIVLVSLGVAWCSYRFIEQPFRKSETPTVPLLKKYAVLCILIVLPSFILFAMKGLPRRFPDLAAVEQRSGLRLDENECLVQYGVSSPNLSQSCVPQSDAREGVALLGDSHAGALGEAMREIAQQNNLKFYEMGKASCPALVGVTRRMPNHPGHDKECASFNEKSIDLVRKDASIRMVFLAGYWSAPFVEEGSGARYVLNGQSSPVSPDESSGNLGQGLAAAVATLSSAGKEVVVLKDVPLFDFDPVRRLRSEFIPARAALEHLIEGGKHDADSAGLDEIVAGPDNRASAIIDRIVVSPARVFDLKQNLCSGQSCSFYEDGMLLYTDPQHVSLAGSRRALRGLPMAIGQ